ncbi:unnamed protein product [Parascedosporium putredinis]|uniref:Ras modification protein ERF4 n=1 Tax=Parascedosporium putredinis TaxID=1442378 RepID=A0A9P1GX15_9PEZI|nr:unnamed protein product [Parascedosporium putredinis]CAI7988624.1 unnamed protein product [Parascedosporium putredinis]
MLGFWSGPAKPFSAQPPIVTVATPEDRPVPVPAPTQLTNGTCSPNLDTSCSPLLHCSCSSLSRLPFPGHLTPESDAPAAPCTLSEISATCPPSLPVSLPLSDSSPIEQQARLQHDPQVQFLSPIVVSVAGSSNPIDDSNPVDHQGFLEISLHAGPANRCRNPPIELPQQQQQQQQHAFHPLSPSPPSPCYPYYYDDRFPVCSASGRILNPVQTDPHASTNPPSPNPAALGIDESRNPRIYSPSVQPSYPGLSSPAVEQHDLANSPQPLSLDPITTLAPETVAFAVPPPPPEPLADNFQRVAQKSTRRTPSLALALPKSRRLCESSPSTPTWRSSPLEPNKFDATRRKGFQNRSPATSVDAPLPSVPLSHPVIGAETDAGKPPGTGSGETPLLSLAEQRQIKHPAQSRPSLQIEHCGASEKRVSLPPSVRHSYDEKRSTNATPTPTHSDPSDWPLPVAIQEQSDSPASKRLDKGKAREAMPPTHDATEERGSRSFSKDLERGPDILDPRLSEVDPEAIQEWGPQHPCYPHLNPYVPANSAEYASTRIIRVRRDFLIAGDLAPTFSNTYPDILDPVGLSEQEFRRVIEKLNADLVRIHSPYSWRNILDATLGLLTGWIWDDLGLTGAKAQLNALEAWIERWNAEMEKTLGGEDGLFPPKIIPLRKTAYMTLDIQIPDPEIAAVPNTPSEQEVSSGKTPSRPPPNYLSP